MNIHDLTTLTGVTARQVRYLVSEGIIPAPRGGRSNADYGDDHVAGIQRYRSLQDAGFRHSVIRDIMVTGPEGQSEVSRDVHRPAPPTVVDLVPGVMLTIDPSALQPGLDRAALRAAVVKALDDFLPE